MANPTTNYGWVMPTSTDLVTDLPADFAVFGQAVDTSMADLKGGTTGQILSKTSATDMDFTWVAPTTGDITGVTAGTGISGGGTSGDVTVTNSMATAMTTSGDLIQATGSGTFARLGTGTNGQYLTTNGTTNSWATPAAGGMTLISTTTLTGASITLSSIPQTYNSLVMVIRNFLPATDTALLRLRFNADSTANRHYTQETFGNTGGIAFNSTFIATTADNDNGVGSGLTYITFPDYTNATTWKQCFINSLGVDPTTTTSLRNFNAMGNYNQTAAISSFSLLPNVGNFTSGTVLLYGVK
jgi:hypothetical protein